MTDETNRHSEDRPARREDPYRLIRFVAVSAGDGVAAGWTLLLLFVELDVQGLGTLVKDNPDGPLAMAMLAFVFAITFSMVGVAWRVMVILPNHDD